MRPYYFFRICYNDCEFMYEYQKNNRFFAQIADGIKELGVQELTDLGARNVSSAYRGIYFDADMETLYRVNYASRLVSRVLAPLAWFRCHTTDQLHKKAMEIQWTDFISHKNTFAIFSNVSNSKIRNSQFASLRLKDASSIRSGTHQERDRALTQGTRTYG